jgi:hypothetical protein
MATLSLGEDMVIVELTFRLLKDGEQSEMTIVAPPEIREPKRAKNGSSSPQF